MSNNQPYFPRQGVDERAIIKEMMADQHSEHWEKCNLFVKKCVYAKAKNIPSNLQEDIVQEVMYKITKSLEHFRFECTFKTWINLIVEHCIIDERRKLQNEERVDASLADPPNDGDHEGRILDLQRAKTRLRVMKQATLDVIEELNLSAWSKFAVMSIMYGDSQPLEKTFLASEAKSAEEVFMISDEIRNGKEAMLEYANTHSNPTRDRLILRMVIDERRTHAEAAIAAGCSISVVSCVIRKAQRYAREKTRHSL